METEYTKPRSESTLAATDHCTLQQQSDYHLIERVVQGDSAAQRLFVARYERYIRSILNQMALPPQDREDIFQETFYRLWNRDCRCLRRWRPLSTAGGFQAYLRVIVNNVAIDFLRKRKDLVSLSAFEESEDTLISGRNQPLSSLEQDWIKRERCLEIRRAVYQLSARDTELIWRRFYLRESYNEISKAVGLTTSHVGVYLARAKERLSRSLKCLNAD